MEKNTYVNPFEEVHKKARAAHERLKQVREKDLLIRETQQTAESVAREKHESGRPRPLISKPEISSKEQVSVPLMVSNEDGTLTAGCLWFDPSQKKTV
jgi:hypothetical protein